MFYSSTIPVLKPICASLDREKKTLKIKCEKPEKPAGKEIKFLFVGNSATYFSGTPLQFEGLCLSAGLNVSVDYCTFGCATFLEFADENHERGKKYRKMLKEKKYDYIVFQDAEFQSYENSEKALEILLPLAEENGGEPLLYMRYTSLGVDDIVKASKIHHDKYTRLSEKFGLVCAPSADAFLKSSLYSPEINLNADDRNHHSKAGAYIIACTWLETFLGKSPVGNRYISSLDEKTAEILQKTAHSVCKDGFIY